MINFCPECGIKLEKDYKFCPNCGIQLTQTINSKNQTKEDFEYKENDLEKVYCKNCGEENDISNTVCYSCGIKLQNISAEKRNVNKKAAGKKNKPNRILYSNTADAKFQKQGKKRLNSRVIYLMLGALIIVGAVIFFSSDMLNKTSMPDQVSNQGNSNQSGVDLSSINKINELESQLKTTPNNLELRLQLAHLQNDAGFYNKAIDNYKIYLGKNPKDTDARIDMGVCYYNLGNYTTAIDEMQKALNYQPNHQIGNLNLGIVNLAAGNIEKSKEWLKKAVGIDPNSDAGKKAEELLKSHENNGGN